MWRAGIRNLRPAAVVLLREAVERRLAGYVGGPDGGPEAGEDLVVWRQREAAWLAAREAIFSARLDWIARKVKCEMT